MLVWYDLIKSLIYDSDPTHSKVSLAFYSLYTDRQPRGTGTKQGAQVHSCFGCQLVVSQPTRSTSISLAKYGSTYQSLSMPRLSQTLCLVIGEGVWLDGVTKKTPDEDSSKTRPKQKEAIYHRCETWALAVCAGMTWFPLLINRLNKYLKFLDREKLQHSYYLDRFTSLHTQYSPALIFAIFTNFKSSLFHFIFICFIMEENRRI